MNIKKPCENRFLVFCTAFFCWIGILVFTLLALYSLVSTGYFPSDYTEIVFYSYTTGFWVLPAATLCLLLFFLLDHYYGLERINERRLQIILMAYTAALALAWVCFTKDTPGADPLVMSLNAVNLLHGDYSWYRPLSYFAQFPFQMSFSILLSGFYALFGEYNVLSYQIFNALCCPLVLLACLKIANKLFNNKRTNVVLVLLSFTAFPLILCSTYVYGNIVSLMLALYALYFAICAIETQKSSHYISSIVLICFAKLLKPNSSIFLIGILMLFFFSALQNKRWRTSIFIVLMVVVIFASNFLLISTMENVTGYDLSNGESQLAWVAMGLQIGPLGCGWFNQYIDSIYIANQGDGALIRTQALSSISDSLINFVRSPAFAFNFFSQKLMSEWCEPTYGMLWCSMPYGERDVSPAIGDIYRGTTHDILVNVLDVQQLLLYAMAAYAFIRKRRSFTLTQMSPAIIIFGGFLYHMICEAKSMYILPYYILTFIYAAYGMSLLFCDVHAFLVKRNPKPSDAQ